MKVFIALFALATLAAGVPEGRFHRHHISQNVTELISSQGYPVDNFTVQTEDGYLLDVIRVPGGKNFLEQWKSQQENHNLKTNKPVVFLMHGMLSSAEDFVIGGPTEGLAYILADRGFDVFLGNSRGNIYAHKHTQLNPEKDAAFWRFCWNDIGKKDLPAMIDEILRMTGQNKLSYVGHMQGTTVFYVMASELPEYNDKIEKMVSLGPIAFMKDASNTMLKTIAENQQSKPVRKSVSRLNSFFDLFISVDIDGQNFLWLLKNLGINEFHPSNELMSVAGQDDCVKRGINERICQNPFFILNGYESNKLNTTTAHKYAQRLPAGASTKQVLHLVQLMKSGRFEKYSENQSEVEDYQLEKITAPVALIYTAQDKITSEENVKMLSDKLPNVISNMRINQLRNNLDLILGQNVESIVYDNVHDILKH